MAKKRRNVPKANTKRSPRRKKSNGAWLKLPSIQLDADTLGRTRKISGLLLLFFSIYLLFAFISHLFTGYADQSLITLGQAPAENWGGTLAAYLARFFITRGFGYAAFLFPPYLFLLGYAIMENRLWNVVRAWTPYVFLSLIWISLFFDAVNRAFAFRVRDLGGDVGNSLFDWFRQYIGGFGVWLLLVFTAAAFLIYRFDIRFSLLEKLGDWLEPVLPERVLKWLKERAQRLRAERIGREAPADLHFDADSNAAPAETEEIPLSAPESADIILSVRKVRGEAPEYQNTEEATGQPQASEETALGTNAGENGLDFEVVIPEGDAADYTSDPHIQPSELARNVQQVGGERLEKIIGEADMPDETDDAVGEWEAYDPTATLSRYEYPHLDLLTEHEDTNDRAVDRAELAANRRKIVETLGHFGITVRVKEVTVGPTITLYEIVPDAGVKISKIKNLEDDIALNLAAEGIRIIAPMPGKGTIGIEIPNAKPAVVSFRSVIATPKFRNTNYELPIALGRTVSNEVHLADLAKLPHLLVAGATGQGKSVGLNVLIASLLYRKHPAQVKFVLIDPKMVEFSLYHTLEQHFLATLPDATEPIVTDTSKALGVLNSLCIEMDNRYELLKMARVRGLKEYNAKFIDRKLNPQNGHKYLPYIVLVVDEYGDLMMTAGKEVEMPIQRLAQKARAVGIHLILATQRPDVKVITGTIKANFPAQIAYKTKTAVDSRTIVDTKGAERLIGRGDMLYSTGNSLVRLQTPFIDTPEVEALVEFIARQPGYPEPYLLPEVPGDDDDIGNLAEFEDRDELFEDAARLIVRSQQGSTSLIQRKMAIGYNRAGRIVDQLERANIVGPARGSKPREVLFADESELERYLSALQQASGL